MRVRAGQGHLRPGILSLNSSSATSSTCNIGHINLPEVKFPNKKGTVKSAYLTTLIRGSNEINDVKSIWLVVGNVFVTKLNKIENIRL